MFTASPRTSQRQGRTQGLQTWKGLVRSFSRTGRPMLPGFVPTHRRQGGFRVSWERVRALHRLCDFERPLRPPEPRGQGLQGRLWRATKCREGLPNLVLPPSEAPGDRGGVVGGQASPELSTHPGPFSGSRSARAAPERGGGGAVGGGLGTSHSEAAGPQPVPPASNAA